MHAPLAAARAPAPVPRGPGLSRGAALVVATALLVVPLGGCLQAPPTAGLTVSGASWQWTDTSGYHGDFGDYYLHVNFTAYGERQPFTATYEEAALLWSNGTRVTKPIPGRSLGEGSFDGVVSFKGDGVTAPESLEIRGAGPTVSAAVPSPSAAPPSETGLHNATAQRSERTLTGSYPPAGSISWWVNVTISNGGQDSLLVERADFGVVGADASVLNAGHLDGTPQLPPGTSANFRLSIVAPDGWTPEAIRFVPSGAAWAFSTLDTLPGTLRFENFTMAVRAADWTDDFGAFGRVDLHLEVEYAVGPFEWLTGTRFEVRWEREANSSEALQTSSSMAFAPLESGIAELAVYAAPEDTPTTLTLVSHQGTFVAPIPRPENLTPRIDFKDLEVFFSNWDGNPYPAQPGNRFFSAWFNLTNVGPYDLRLGAESFEAVDVAGASYPFVQDFYGPAPELAPGAAAPFLLTLQAPDSWVPVAIHCTLFRWGWSWLDVKGPIEFWPEADIDLNVSSAFYGHYGVNGSHAPPGWYYLWLNVSITNRDVEPATARLDRMAVDRDRRYENWVAEGEWSSVVVQPNETVGVEVAFLVPANVSLTRVFLIVYAFGPLAIDSLAPLAPAPDEVSLANASAETKDVDFSNATAPPSRAFLWVMVNVSNAWNASLPLDAARFVVWDAGGRAAFAVAVSGPPSVSAGGMATVTVLFDVSDAFVAASLQYRSSEGPWDQVDL
ncbi:MAG TPA: hypothetical protein VGB42_02555 [Candidatus Thermoplasmatota archaeon]